jgi:hypothetical protein
MKRLKYVIECPGLRLTLTANKTWHISVDWTQDKYTCTVGIMFQEPEAGAYIYMHIRKVSWALLFEYASNETEVSRTFASLPLTCYYTTKWNIMPLVHVYFTEHNSPKIMGENY